MSVFTGKEKLKLGFGLMRLPKNADGSIDIEQTVEMTDLFMEAGGTYFDTAFVYPGSEEAIRKALVEENRLEAVISMPSGVFKPYAGVSTGILLFTKTGHGGTDNVWFYDMTADGFSLDDKRTEVKENDIPDIIARFKNLEGEKSRARTEKSFFVPKEEIVGNEYDLSINKYKKTEYKPVEYPPTSEILAELRSLEVEIAKDMDELEQMLKCENNCFK